MEPQDIYALVTFPLLLWPCIVFLLLLSSFLRHPQDLLLPPVSLLLSKMETLPQSHLHFQREYRLLCIPTNSITVHLPNFCPVLSFTLIIIIYKKYIIKAIDLRELNNGTGNQSSPALKTEVYFYRSNYKPRPKGINRRRTKTNVFKGFRVILGNKI